MQSPALGEWVCEMALEFIMSVCGVLSRPGWHCFCMMCVRMFRHHPHQKAIWKKGLIELWWAAITSRLRLPMRSDCMVNYAVQLPGCRLLQSWDFTGWHSHPCHYPLHAHTQEGPIETRLVTKTVIRPYTKIDCYPHQTGSSVAYVFTH